MRTRHGPAALSRVTSCTGTRGAGAPRRPVRQGRRGHSSRRTRVHPRIRHDCCRAGLAARCGLRPLYPLCARRRLRPNHAAAAGQKEGCGRVGSPPRRRRRRQDPSATSCSAAWPIASPMGPCMQPMCASSCSAPSKAQGGAPPSPSALPSHRNMLPTWAGRPARQLHGSTPAAARGRSTPTASSLLPAPGAEKQARRVAAGGSDRAMIKPRPWPSAGRRWRRRQRSSAGGHVATTCGGCEPDRCSNPI